MPCLVQGKKRSTNLLKPTSDKSLSHSKRPQVLSGANMSQCQLARPKAQCHNGRHAAEDEAQDHGDSHVYVPRPKTKAVLAGLHRKDRGRQNQESKLRSNCLRTFAFFHCYTLSNIQHVGSQFTPSVPDLQALPFLWLPVGNTNCAGVGITCNQMISHLFISSYSFDTKIAWNLCKFYP